MTRPPPSGRPMCRCQGEAKSKLWNAVQSAMSSKRRHSLSAASRLSCMTKPRSGANFARWRHEHPHGRMLAVPPAFRQLQVSLLLVSRVSRFTGRNERPVQSDRWRIA